MFDAEGVLASKVGSLLSILNSDPSSEYYSQPRSELVMGEFCLFRFPPSPVQSSEINEGEMFNKPNRLLWKTPLLS